MISPAWPSRSALTEKLNSDLLSFDHTSRPLPGISTNVAREALVNQMVASIRRLDYTAKLLKRTKDPAGADPASNLFDPERAAILYKHSGQLDEAVWLIFLSTHFGKHPRHGWAMLRDVYSGLGGQTWTWERVSQSPAAFRAWLTANTSHIRGGFGNHRKYESANGDRQTGTGATVESYVEWIGAARSHHEKFADLIREGGNDPHSIFERFYKRMEVARFGRLGKFDFLCQLGRLGLAPIEPGRAYLNGATGPLRGARLLFGGNPEAPLGHAKLEAFLIELDEFMQVGMQVMEDSLCNWQKSPTQFVHFKG